jgi:hypothetical protein
MQVNQLITQKRNTTAHRNPVKTTLLGSDDGINFTVIQTVDFSVQQSVSLQVRNISTNKRFKIIRAVFRTAGEASINMALFKIRGSIWSANSSTE